MSERGRYVRHILIAGTLAAAAAGAEACGTGESGKTPASSSELTRTFLTNTQTPILASETPTEISTAKFPDGFDELRLVNGKSVWEVLSTKRTDGKVFDQRVEDYVTTEGRDYFDSAGDLGRNIVVTDTSGERIIKTREQFFDEVFSGNLNALGDSEMVVAYLTAGNLNVVGFEIIDGNGPTMRISLDTRPLVDYDCLGREVVRTDYFVNAEASSIDGVFSSGESRDVGLVADNVCILESTR